MLTLLILTLLQLFQSIVKIFDWYQGFNFFGSADFFIDVNRLLEIIVLFVYIISGLSDILFNLFPLRTFLYSNNLVKRICAMIMILFHQTVFTVVWFVVVGTFFIHTEEFAFLCLARLAEHALGELFYLSWGA